MKGLRIVKLSFLGILIFDTVLLLSKSIAARKALLIAGPDFSFVELNTLQKPIGILNICFFTVLLILASWVFYIEKRKMFIYLTNLIFIAFTLFNYVTLNRMFFELGDQDANKSGSYWLMVFIGLFYIVGAITISAIAFIAVRNLNRHRLGDKGKEQNNTKKKHSFK
jgi:hypothetical protein